MAIVVTEADDAELEERAAAGALREGAAFCCTIHEWCAANLT